MCYVKKGTIPPYLKSFLWCSGEKDIQTAQEYPLGKGDIRRAIRRLYTLLDSCGLRDFVSDELYAYARTCRYSDKQLRDILERSERLAYNLSHVLPQYSNPALIRAYCDAHIVTDTAHKLLLRI